MQPCEQHDKIKHIEADLENHKVWRKEVSAQLTTIEIGVATGNAQTKAMLALYDEKLKKYDDHVAQGHVWHNFIVGNAIVLAMIIVGSVWWGATLQRDTDRLIGLHPYGTVIVK